MKYSFLGLASANLKRDSEHHYELMQELGQGALSVVKCASHRESGQRYAVKVVQKSQLHLEDQEALLAEAKLMQELDHPNIVKLHGLFDERNAYYLVMDLIEGGELFDRIVAKESYNEKEARDLIRVLLDTLKYCHGLNIVHRDIKPEVWALLASTLSPPLVRASDIYSTPSAQNLLCVSSDDDSTIKLCDFGFASRVTDDGAQLPNSALRHTWIRRSRDLEANIVRQRCRFVVGRDLDLHSARWLPSILRRGSEQIIHQDQMRRFRIPRGYWSSISEEAKDLIAKMLVVDPVKRSIATAALDHPWVIGDDHWLASRDLSTNLREFKRYNGKRKFKATAEGTHRCSEAIACT